jgi:photosystem I protein
MRSPYLTEIYLNDALVLVCLEMVNKYGEPFMTAKSASGATTKTSKPPYPYRTFWALVLLVGNFVVAAFYFGILK